MYQQVSLLIEALPALGTYKLLFSCVNSLMSAEVRAVGETFLACRTLIRFLASVDPLVVSQFRGSAEVLPTFQAFERFLSKVDFFMSP